MQNRFAIFLIFGITGFANFSHAVSSELFQKYLGQYCVPTANTCSEYGGIFEPKRQDGVCSCFNNDYLIYDETQRKCKPKCPKGYKVTKVDTCPKGSRRMIVRREE